MNGFYKNARILGNVMHLWLLHANNTNWMDKMRFMHYIHTTTMTFTQILRNVWKYWNKLGNLLK